MIFDFCMRLFLLFIFSYYVNRHAPKYQGKFLVCEICILRSDYIVGTTEIRRIDDNTRCKRAPCGVSLGHIVIVSLPGVNAVRTALRHS